MEDITTVRNTTESGVAARATDTGSTSTVTPTSARSTSAVGGRESTIVGTCMHREYIQNSFAKNEYSGRSPLWSVVNIVHYLSARDLLLL